MTQLRAIGPLLLLLLVASCGGTYIVMEIHSDLAITEDVAQLHIVCVDPDQPEVSLANVSPQLEEGQSFPIDVSLQPSANTTEKLLVFRATAIKNGLTVAYGETFSRWKRGRTNTIPVETSPPQ